MSRFSDIGTTALAALLGLGVLGWNLERFIGAEVTIRMDPHLEFLPDPTVARTLTLGHHNTVAKLRWIDSFSYFSYQLEHTDDSGGFSRLYETLIALDPRFRPFYEHATTSVGGIMGDHHGELRFCMLGVQNLPQSTALWASLVAALSVHYRLEERHPEQMENILERWGEMERAKPDGREHLPGDWLAALARRHQRGLGQVTYWGRLLLVSDPTAPEADVARRVMREQLTRHGVVRLQALVDDHRERTGAPPEDLRAVLTPEALGEVYPSPSAALDPAEPITRIDGSYHLRPDPYGGEYVLDDAGAVTSTGLERFEFEKWLGQWNRLLRNQAIDRRRWPESVAQAREWVGHDLSAPPQGGELRVVDGLLEVAWSAAVTRDAWQDPELLAAAGLDPEARRSPGAAAE